MDRRLIGLAALIALAAVALLSQRSGGGQAPAATGKSGTGFDYYVLALSWSPSYCASKGSSADPEQCGLAKPLGFTVHGLWPQYERGAPQDCAVNSRQVDRDILRKIGAVMPSDGLARHEWQKHGTCSGLSKADYFDQMIAASAKVRIPGMFSQALAARTVSPSLVETQFLKANPGMNAQGFAAACGGGYLTEVRICLSKGLEFRDCPEVDRNACRANAVKMPAAN